MRTWMLASAVALLAACGPAEAARGTGGGHLSSADSVAIADSLRRLVVAASDLSTDGAVARLLSLYPDSGRVVSAGGGQVNTSRDSLEASIRAFWDNVGHNMQGPRWTWGQMHVDVLGPDAAVMTGTYTIPHRTPRGEPHVVGGAWTAVFERRDGRWVIVQEHLSDMPAAAET